MYVAHTSDGSWTPEVRSQHQLLVGRSQLLQAVEGSVLVYYFMDPLCPFSVRSLLVCLSFCIFFFCVSFKLSLNTNMKERIAPFFFFLSLFRAKHRIFLHTITLTRRVFI